MERAVDALKAGHIPDIEAPLAQSTEVELGIPAILPGDYVADVHTRLILYKRIASAKDNEALDELKVEFINRFGLLPEPAQSLFRATEFKLQCQQLGVKKLEAGQSGGRLVFDEKPKIDPMQLIQLIQQSPEEYRFDGQHTFKFNYELEEPAQRIDYIADLLAKFQIQL